MELPTKILIGEGVLEKLGSFVEETSSSKKIVIVSGKNVRKALREVVESCIKKNHWVEINEANYDNVQKVVREARDAGSIVGIGGGKSVDVAKLAASVTGLRFYSVPTSASHDGIASPFASLKGAKRPYSEKAKPPYGILADVNVISSAPRRLLASGCGDLVSKLTAVKDWQLARDEKGEYYGNYAASLALMSASVVLSANERPDFGKDTVRDVVEALISAGVAAGIAGSSRPCSGSEHLFSHYLEIIAPGVGLHGEKCGIGTIMMAKLHGLDWERVRKSLMMFGAPVSAMEIGLSEEHIVESLTNASSVRPERYTILSKVRLTKDEAYNLARTTHVI
jgi:glycerol-1-phosphate dehydrogenase [NAD(P)+]